MKTLTAFMLVMFHTTLAFGQQPGRRHDLSPTLYEAAGRGEARGEWPDMSTVVMIAHGDVTGSGVVIHPQWILTAAHNLYDAGGDSPVLPRASEVEVFHGAANFNRAFSVRASRLILHPNWREAGLEGDALGYDLALIQLETELPIVPALLPPFRMGMPLSTRVVGAGFGDYSDFYGDPEYDARGAWENTLDRAHTHPQTGLQLLAYDFDSPDGTVNPLSLRLEEGEDVVGGGDSNPQPLALEGSSVPGDSGGPLFLKVGRDWLVVGIASHGLESEEAYGDIAVYTGVVPHLNWIYRYVPRR